jgi:hypothetical protein
MPNLELANQLIDECNVKFCNGSANQLNHPLDDAKSTRQSQMDAYRPRLRGMLSNAPTAQDRAFHTGKALDHMPEVTIGNCGERSYWVYYKLRERNVPNVSVLSGLAGNSINHDFVVIGATNVATGVYSQDTAPVWLGNDIVICDPWFQAGWVLYSCGIAYPVDAWPTWMPKIVAVTLAGRPNEHTLVRTAFTLTLSS